MEGWLGVGFNVDNKLGVGGLGVLGWKWRAVLIGLNKIHWGFRREDVMRGNLISLVGGRTMQIREHFIMN